MRTIIEIAREAGLRDCTCDGTKGCLERLVELVRADERTQRIWVGLTDEERKRVRNTVGYNQLVTAGEYAEHVQKATEAKLKEKNT